MTSFFGELTELRGRPIPDLGGARLRRAGYRSHPIDGAGQLASEPLVDLTALGIRGENHYHRLDGPPYYERAPGSIPGLWLRRSAALRLQAVDARLRASGLALHVFDGYRPTAVQAYFHDVWMPARVRADKPSLTPAEVLVEVEGFWAAPTTAPDSPAPHATGGAVDLTLALARNGEQLPMGTIFDDMSAAAATDYFELGGDPASYSDQEARQNRRLLYWVMNEAGFANHPNEWWHFCWQDQMWARLTGAASAGYGLAQAPPEAPHG